MHSNRIKVEIKIAHYENLVDERVGPTFKFKFTDYSDEILP
jgi:hypothetical protein